MTAQGPVPESVRAAIAQCLNSSVDVVLAGNSHDDSDLTKSSLATVLNALRQQCAEVFCQRAREHNAKLPDLPTEVWHAVWLHLGSRDRFASSHVSSLWRARALDEPQLWSEFDFASNWDTTSEPCGCWVCFGVRPVVVKDARYIRNVKRQDDASLKRLTHFIRRSGTRPFTLRIVLPHTTPSGETTRRLRDLLQDYVIGRVRVVGLDVSVISAEIEHLLGVLPQAPLHTFRITCHDGVPQPTTGNSFVLGRVTRHFSHACDVSFETGSHLPWHATSGARFTSAHTLRCSFGWPGDLDPIPAMFPALHNLICELSHGFGTNANGRGTRRRGALEEFRLVSMPRMRNIKIVLDAASVGPVLTEMFGGLTRRLETLLLKIGNSDGDDEGYIFSAMSALETLRDVSGPDATLDIGVCRTDELLHRNAGPVVFVISTQSEKISRTLWWDYDAIFAQMDSVFPAIWLDRWPVGCLRVPAHLASQLLILAGPDQLFGIHSLTIVFSDQALGTTPSLEDVVLPELPSLRTLSFELVDRYATSHWDFMDAVMREATAITPECTHSVHYRGI